MRELKFRQKVIINGDFARWHYWGFINGVFIGPAHQELSSISYGESYQYTGLKTMNNKQGEEVFEHDFVLLDDPIDGIQNNMVFEIRFNAMVMAWELYNYDSGRTYNCPKSFPTIGKIIGNRFENPEFMNGQE